MTCDIETKKLLVDFYLRMREEQTAAAQHHETQRATVTTMFASLAVAILAIIGALSQAHGMSLALLPLTLGLVIIGFVGFRLVVKLFERSMSHFSLAEAYLDSLRQLLAEDVRTCFGDQVTNIKYVAKAAAELEQHKLDTGMFDIDFPGGARKEGAVTPEMLSAELARHNPVDPRPLVVPRHNRAVMLPERPRFLRRNYAKVNLREQWEHIYEAVVLLGLGLSAVAVWFEFAR